MLRLVVCLTFVLGHNLGLGLFLVDPLLGINQFLVLISLLFQPSLRTLLTSAVACIGTRARAGGLLQVVINIGIQRDHKYKDICCECQQVL